MIIMECLVIYTASSISFDLTKIRDPYSFAFLFSWYLFMEYLYKFVHLWLPTNVAFCQEIHVARDTL